MSNCNGCKYFNEMMISVPSRVDTTGTIGFVRHPVLLDHSRRDFFCRKCKDYIAKEVYVGMKDYGETTIKTPNWCPGREEKTNG